MASAIGSGIDTGTITWAARNPDRPVQPLCICASKTTHSDASLGTRTLLRKNTKASLDLVQEAVLVYLNKQEKFIDDLAQQYLIDKERIKKMIIHGLTYASARGPSLSNAILHYKAKELNENCVSGECLILRDLQDKVYNDPELDPLRMSKACKKKHIDELIQRRTLKAQGSRSNNHALAINAHQNIKAIMVECMQQRWSYWEEKEGMVRQGQAKDKGERATIKEDKNVVATTRPHDKSAEFVDDEEEDLQPDNNHEP
ncbi:hypothetical protein C0992_010839 [Termitomyces sp. T32_za158]|nr:hypothetical protein C0992_010839 [Termitomyces sp. T32_za158]